MPNDWIYAECRAACAAIDDESLSDDDGYSLHSHADSQVDTYTRDLFQWGADMCLTDTYSNAESEAEDCGFTEGATIEEHFRAIQYHAVYAIAATILGAWTKEGNA